MGAGHGSLTFFSLCPSDSYARSTISVRNRRSVNGLVLNAKRAARDVTLSSFNLLLWQMTAKERWSRHERDTRAPANKADLFYNRHSHSRPRTLDSQCENKHCSQTFYFRLFSCVRMKTKPRASSVLTANTRGGCFFLVLALRTYARALAKSPAFEHKTFVESLAFSFEGDWKASLLLTFLFMQIAILR